MQPLRATVLRLLSRRKLVVCLETSSTFQCFVFLNLSGGPRLEDPLKLEGLGSRHEELEADVHLAHGGRQTNVRVGNQNRRLKKNT
jgi:hypothetical protein